MGEPDTGDSAPGDDPGPARSQRPGLAHDRARAGGGAGARALFALAILVNLLVVFWPAPPSDAVGLFPHADKVAHILVFAAVAWTGRRARIPLVPLVLLLGAHGVTSELVQHLLLPARGGDIADTAADLGGVAAGCVLPLGGLAARLGP